MIYNFLMYSVVCSELFVFIYRLNRLWWYPPQPLLVSAENPCPQR